MICEHCGKDDGHTYDCPTTRVELKQDRRQKVYLSRTLSGIPGLFTNNFLVMKIPEADATPERARAFAESRGFAFVKN